MKILLYAEPTGVFIWWEGYRATQAIYDHLYLWLTQELLQHKDVEIKTIVPELALQTCDDTATLQPLSPIVFKDEYLQQIFPHVGSLEEANLKILTNQLSDKEYDTFRSIIIPLLPEGWSPELVISFPPHNDLLKHTFPKALHLLVDNGLFSRAPFFRSVRFDPFHHCEGFPNRYKEAIRNFPITSKQRDSLSQFKRQLQQIINKHNPLKQTLEQLRKKFRYLILCPVPPHNRYKENLFDDQYLYLLHVLQKIPAHIGLIVTFHDIGNSQLNPPTIKLLQKKYPNLIWFPPDKQKFFSRSLNYFGHIDAIINTQTMTGTQALLWDVKVISLDKSYSKWFCDKSGLENLEEFLAQPTPDHAGLLYWYMTHFTVYEKNFNKPNWYYNFFKTKLEKFHQNGITFDLYEQLEDFDALSKYILDYVQAYYCPWAKFKRWAFPFYLKGKICLKKIKSLFTKF